MNTNKKYHSDFLVSKSSFLIGVGSLFNIAGNYFPFNKSASGDEADTRAIESDWGMIGHDIEQAYINRDINKEFAK